MSNMSSKKILIFMGCIALIVGIGFIGIGAFNIYKGLESQNWGETQGIILSSQIEERQETDRDYDGGVDTTYTVYIAKIQYQYTVNGETHISNKISYSYGSTQNKSDAQKLVNKYPSGKSVTVYYNPSNHDEAVLQTGVSDLNYIMTLAGVLPLIIGIVFLYLAFRTKKSKKLNISLEKVVYQPGETIKGNINISLKKPKFANNLKVTLTGKKELINIMSGSNSKFLCPMLTIEKNIDTEKDYFNDSYYFSIKIPEDALIKAETCTDDVIGFVGNKPIIRKNRPDADPTQKKYLSGAYLPGKNVWSVEAELDIDHGRNIKNTIDLTISKTDRKNTYL